MCTWLIVHLFTTIKQHLQLHYILVSSMFIDALFSVALWFLRELNNICSQSTRFLGSECVQKAPVVTAVP